MKTYAAKKYANALELYHRKNYTDAYKIFTDLCVFDANNYKKLFEKYFGQNYWFAREFLPGKIVLNNKNVNGD